MTSTTSQTVRDREVAGLTMTGPVPIVGRATTERQATGPVAVVASGLGRGGDEALG